MTRHAEHEIQFLASLAEAAISQQKKKNGIYTSANTSESFQFPAPSAAAPGSTASRHLRADVIESTDVLVIGNGPSAITLSFLLSGRWPYYRSASSKSSPSCSIDDNQNINANADNQHDDNIDEERHPIDYLHQRLSNAGADRSLLEQDLDALSNGLSGRTLNRVSILFDQLQNPNCDLGHRQRSTLRWRHHADRAIDHVILGTGLPGGLWHSLRKSKTALTVSRQKWMQLPERPILRNGNGENPADNEEDPNRRISYGSIAQYYRDYVEHFELSKYFRNYSRVTRVEWCPGLDCWIVDALSKKQSDVANCGVVDSSSVSGPSANENIAKKSSKIPLSETANQCLLKHLKCLAKFRRCKNGRNGENSNSSNAATSNISSKDSGDSKWLLTRYLARSVVLATGANSCSPSTLALPSEYQDNHFAINTLDQLDGVLRARTAITSIGRPMPAANPTGNSERPTLLIVGSGLSSADACLLIANANAQISTPSSPSLDFSQYRVLHIFRRSIQDRALIFNQLKSNENLYPEYNQVFRRMRSTSNRPLCPDCFSSGRGDFSSSYHQRNNSSSNNNSALSQLDYQAYQQAELGQIITDQSTDSSKHRNRTYSAIAEIVFRSASNSSPNSSPLRCYACDQPLDRPFRVAISLLLTLIGSKPALDFLPPNIAERLAHRPAEPIDIRSNPIRINTITHETIAAKRLYAIGPLVGDNFVRYVQGGALAVAAHQIRLKREAAIESKRANPEALISTPMIFDENDDDDNQDQDKEDENYHHEIYQNYYLPHYHHPNQHHRMLAHSMMAQRTIS